MKQCQQFGSAVTDIFMGLLFGLSLRLPAIPLVGDGLEWPSFVLRPNAQAQRLSDLVSLLDQSFFPSASGSVTSTATPFRLRVTVPVLHQVRSFCQVHPASCKASPIV